MTPAFVNGAKRWPPEPACHVVRGYPPHCPQQFSFGSLASLSFLHSDPIRYQVLSSAGLTYESNLSFEETDDFCLGLVFRQDSSCGQDNIERRASETGQDVIHSCDITDPAKFMLQCADWRMSRVNISVVLPVFAFACKTSPHA
jgi:hypothetical protein